jgi:hypothetical protein
VLEFRGLRRPLLRPGHFTELFFLDEATALAAGHRPCAVCRRDDYLRLVAIWRGLHPGQVGADAQLHTERVVSGNRAQRRHPARVQHLPDGAFILHTGDPYLVFGDRLLRWTPAGYADPISRPARGAVVVCTPPSLVSILRAGWHSRLPLLHPSAFSPRTRYQRSATKHHHRPETGLAATPRAASGESSTS